MSDAEAWSTIVVAMAEPARSPARMREVGEQLEALAALLAEREDVGGVESRDPFTIAEGPDFPAVEQPELVVYTTPAAREAVAGAIAVLAEALGFELRLVHADHEGDAWRDAWKRHYRSQRFAGADGRARLLLRPSWIERAPGDPECELILDPGRAFGTGLHESTRLCLQLLVELAPELAAADVPPRVLDLGCGSGILGLALLRLAPAIETVVLGDHDPEAVATSEENAAANQLEDRVDTRVISLAGAEDPTGLAAEERFDLLIANIRPKVLIPAAPVITRALADGGSLLLSGILDEEAEAVRAAYPELELEARPSETGWTALLLTRPAS